MRFLFLSLILCVVFIAPSLRGAETSPEAWRPVIGCEEFLESLGLAAGPFEKYLDSGRFAGAGTKYPPEFFFDLGNGVRFTVPADRKLRRLRLYAGLLNGAAGRLTAKLSDHSAPELVSTGWSGNKNGVGFLWAAQPGSVSVVYEIEYRSAKDGETLEVFWGMENEPNRFNGQFRLGAITLSE